MAGEPAHDEVSPLAKNIYGANAAGLMRRRLAEDDSALDVLGVSSTRLDLLDAIYRRSHDGEFLYSDHAALFGDPARDDAHLANEIARAVRTRWPSRDELHIIAPLALGNHVDHQLARDAAVQLRAGGYSVTFYEDFPYSISESPANSLLNSIGLAAFSVQLSERHLERKIKAASCYLSQLDVLFGGPAAMARAIAQHDDPGGDRGVIQRFWR